jgi:enoyl-[acyl-carrier-protein] reductase (NADH)
MEKMGTYNLLNSDVVQPYDVVNTILFLASDDAKFITGEIIKVDNGFSLNHDLSFSKID